MSRRRAIGRWLQEGGLYALLVLLPFSKAAVEITFGLLFVGWCLEHIGRGGWQSSVWSRPASRWLLVALASYLVACALSIFASQYMQISLRGLVSKTLEYALFLFIVADLTFQRPRVLRYGVPLLLIGALFACGDALAQQWLGRDPIHGYLLDFYGRITGPYENPNDLAAYLVVMIPLALSQLLITCGWRRVFACSALGIAAACLIMTMSQGAGLGLAVALLCMCCCDRRLRRVALIFSGVAGAIAVVMSRVIKDPIGVGLQDRLYMWQAAWRMWLDQPFFGHGLNTFMSQYLTYWVGGEQAPRYAHNCYLQVAAETGVAGLITFLWFLGSLLAVVIRGIQRAATVRERQLIAGLLAALIAFLSQSFVDTNFYALRQAALFWTLAGLTLGYVWSATQPARGV